MQYKEPDFSVDQTTPSSVSAVENGSQNFPQSWLQRLIGRFSIRQKIGWGYALAIGVTVLGTSAGQIIGENIIEKQAWQEGERARQEERLLSKLKIAVLEARSHQQQFISIQENPKLFEQEYTHFLGQIAKVKELFSELNSNVASNFNNLEPDTKDLETFIENYNGAVDAYIQNLEAVLKQIELAHLQPNSIPAARASLLEFTKSEVALKFDALSDDLTALIKQAHQEEAAAEAVKEQAEILRASITIASMLVSIAIAAAMAIYTSRAIARPIEATTKVAQLVTESGNFDLTAPVTTSDEVGRLTASLNQLIQRIATYTQELRQAQTERDRFFNLSLDPLCIAGFDGYFKQVNPAWSKTLGFTKEELLAKPFIEFVHAEDWEITIAELQKLITGIPTTSFENRYLCADGSYKWLVWTSIPSTAEGLIYAVVRDITEQKLSEESRTRLVNILETTTDFVDTVDMQGRAVYLNQTGRRWLGIPLDADISNAHISEVHSESVLKMILEEAIPTAIRNGVWSGETAFHCADGREIPTSHLFLVHRAPDGTPQFISSIARDISDRKQAESALRESEQRYQTLADLSPVGIFHTDALGSCLYVNERWCAIAGLTPNEALGEGWVRAIHPEYRDRVFAEWDKAAKENLPFRLEYRFQRPDGTTSWIFGQAVAHKGNSGEVTGYVGTVTDISDRKRMEETLKQANETLEIRVAERTAELRQVIEQLSNEMASRARAEEALHKEQEFLNALLNNLQAGIVACDANGVLTLFNAATREFHGLPEQPIPSEQWAQHYDLYMPDGKTPMQKENIPLFRALQGETIRDAEMTIAPKQGKARTILASGQAIFDAAGKKLGAVVAMHDISARKEAEAALRLSELRLNSILNSIKDVVWSVEFENAERSKIAFINPAAEKLYDRPLSDFFSNYNLWYEVIHPLDRDRATEYYQNILQQGSSEIEYRIILPSGYVRWVHNRAWLIRDETGAVIRMDGLTSDINERKIAEKTQARLTAILEATPDFVGIADASSGRALYVNKAGRKMLGIGENEDITTMLIPDFMGKSVIEFIMNEGWSTVLREGVWSGETAFRHRDGREVPISQVWMSHKSENGEVEFFSTIARDITERKLAEEALRSSEAKLAAAQTVAHVGWWEYDLATGVATWSEEHYRIFGMEPNSAPLNYQGYLQKVHPSDVEVLVKATEGAIAQGKSFEVDLRILLPDGEIGHVSSKGRPIFNTQGEVIKLFGTTLDISDRKQTEEALRQREEQLRRIVQNMPVMMKALDADGNITVWNRECERVTGYSADEIVGNPKALELLYPDPNYRASVMTLKAELGNNYRNWEWKLTAKDGTVKTLAWSNISEEFPIPGWAGWSIGVDITERKAVEAALAERASLAAFRADVDIALTRNDTLQGILHRCAMAVVEHLDAAFARVWTLNVQENALELQASAGIYTHIDGPHSRVPVGKFKIGLIAEELKPHLTNSVVDDPRVSDKEWAKREGIIAFAGYPLMLEDELLGVVAMFSRKPLAESTLKGLAFAADEIALGIKRKQTEEALRRSEARFRQLAQREELLNQLASLIRKSLDVDTILETAVQEIRNLLQIDRCLFIWYRPSAMQPVWDVVKEAKLPALSSLLGQHPVKVTPLVEKFLNREIICADDLATATDPVMQELYATWGYTALLGLPIQTPSGDIGMLSCGHHSGSRTWSECEIELLQAAIDQLAIALFQAELYTSAQNSAQQAREKAQQLQETLHELKQTQAQLIQTEKMSSLGQMVAGVAHEINNPVNFIHGNLTHLSDYTQELLALVSLYQQNCPNPDPELQKAISEIDLDFLAEDLPKIVSSIKIGTERIRNIVLSLRNFSRLDETDMKAVNIHEGIDNTLLILQHRLKAKPNDSVIQIVKEYGNLPKVECYAQQLNQVFMNIINNAIDALLELPAPTKQIAIQTEAIASNQIMVRIRDNGPGITPEIKNNIFDPFFTTKPVGKGTGLGLSISYQIIEKHGGKISVNSQPGEGTEFAIALPVKQAIAA